MLHPGFEQVGGLEQGGGEGAGGEAGEEVVTWEGGGWVLVWWLLVFGGWRGEREGWGLLEEGFLGGPLDISLLFWRIL